MLEGVSLEMVTNVFGTAYHFSWFKDLTYLYVLIYDIFDNEELKRRACISQWKLPFTMMAMIPPKSIISISCWEVPFRSELSFLDLWIRICFKHGYQLMIHDYLLNFNGTSQ